MQDIKDTLSLEPDLVYIVDEDTAKNVEISLKKTDGNGLNQIPLKFSDCFEKFLNQTNLLTKKPLINILRIKTIDTHFIGGLTYLDKKTNVVSLPSIIPFGGKDKYNRDTAINQLKDNLSNLKSVTGITGDLYIIIRMINPFDSNLIAVFISKIPKVPIALPPRIKNGGSNTFNNKYFYKYLKYKQKYLEAQQLYGKELKGGVISTYTIYCPEQIYNLIKKLYDSGFKQFKILNCFFLTLGYNSYYSTNIDKRFKNCWTEIILDDKIISIGSYKTFNLSLDKENYTIQIIHR
jgi:hypothetical protein